MQLALWKESKSCGTPVFIVFGRVSLQVPVDPFVPNVYDEQKQHG